METDKDSWKWIFYKTTRTYLRFQGTFQSEDDLTNLQFVNQEVDGVAPEEKCEMDSKCVAIVKTFNTSTAVLMDNILFYTFKMSENKSTLLKMNVSQI